MKERIKQPVPAKREDPKLQPSVDGKKSENKKRFKALPAATFSPTEIGRFTNSRERIIARSVEGGADYHTPRRDEKGKLLDPELIFTDEQKDVARENMLNSFNPGRKERLQEEELESLISDKTDADISGAGLWSAVDLLAKLYHEDEQKEKAKGLFKRLAANEEGWYDGYIRRSDGSAALYRAGRWIGYLEKLGDSEALEVAKNKIRSTLFVTSAPDLEGPNKLGDVISKKEFEQIGLDWARLNKKYDDSIQNFFNNPSQKVFSPDELDQLASMQQELYELEQRWFQIARSNINIQE